MKNEKNCMRFEKIPNIPIVGDVYNIFTSFVHAFLIQKFK